MLSGRDHHSGCNHWSKTLCTAAGCSRVSGASSSKECQCGGLAPTPTASSSSPAGSPTCYVGILLDQPLAEIAPEPGRVLVIAPAALLHREIPQPEGQVVYDLLTGHPDRAPRELVFLADLTVELRAWPPQTWTAVGVSPEAALLAVVDRWRAGQVKGLELVG
jgi:hypothetical protein